MLLSWLGKFKQKTARVLSANYRLNGNYRSGSGSIRTMVNIENVFFLCLRNSITACVSMDRLFLCLSICYIRKFFD